MEFGQKLKEARIRSGFTQEDIVRQVGVSRQTVSNWENNRSYPDLASVLKLSDLYGMSLDDMLKEDTSLQRRIAEHKEKIKKYFSYIHDFAMLLIGSNILLAWLGKTTAGIVLGSVGILLICIVHLLFVLLLGAEWKSAALRCMAMAMWYAGFMIRITSRHSSVIGDLLWFAGIALQCYGSYRMNWDVFYPKHMTAFTGFVIAMVLVFGTIPFVGDFLERGDHIEDNPFNSRDYRVAEVLQGNNESIPMVYLGSTTSVYLDYPGEDSLRLEGKFIYIMQPDGASRKGVWEMIPESDPNTLYRVTLESDNSVTMACYNNTQVTWEYLLELSPKVGCTILDVLGVVTGTVDWYYPGSFDAEELSDGLPLRAKGKIKLSIPGNDDTVTIFEEFYDGDTVEYQTLILTKDNQGFVEFERETRKNGQKQQGIFRIPYEDGEFVLVLNYMQ